MGSLPGTGLKVRFRLLNTSSWRHVHGLSSLSPISKSFDFVAEFSFASHPKSTLVTDSSWTLQRTPPSFK